MRREIQPHSTRNKWYLNYLPLFPKVDPQLQNQQVEIQKRNQQFSSAASIEAVNAIQQTRILQKIFAEQFPMFQLQ